MKHEPMTQERLDAIRERVEVATKGPWAVDSDDPSYIIYSERGGWDGLVIAQVADQDGALFPVEHNGALIAHAPQDLTDLLAEVERLRPRAALADAMIERVARDTAAKESFTGRRQWEDIPRYERTYLRAHAHRVLAADLGTEKEES